VEVQLRKLQETREANRVKTAKPQKDLVAYDDFGRMDIRTATILEAARVPKTKKLLQLKVDTGMDVRTVVSGIAEYFEPEALVGKSVCLLANLEPREIKGITSQGMILLAEDRDGRLVFVAPGERLENGLEIK
jgi:methionyl-tRNA synthetase